MALTCLTGRGSGAKLGLGPVNVKNWPMITAYVAASMMSKVNGALDPVTALTVVMESAVYASKLDPRLVNAQEASA